MSAILSDTAVLIFALNPADDCRRKKIKRGKVLFSALSKHTISEVKRTELPFFHYKGTHQKGNSFGERFANAIEAIFDQGFQNVITLGNDCPQLTYHHILAAEKALRAKKNAIAPSLDGGFNLLGIQHQSFKKDMFQELPWQSKTLFSKTLTYFKLANEVPTMLEAFADIDSHLVLSSLLHQVKITSLLLFQIFKNLTSSALQKYWYLSKTNTSPIYILPFNKGSPLVFS